MSQRRISRQQGFRIERIQAERIARAEKRAAKAEDLLAGGALGDEQRGRIIAHYGVQVAVEALEGEQTGQRFRCHRRANLEHLVTGDEVVWQPAAEAGTQWALDALDLPAAHRISTVQLRTTREAATSYTDGQAPTDVQITDRPVTSADTLTLDLKGSGGAAVRLTPR